MAQSFVRGPQDIKELRALMGDRAVDNGDWTTLSRQLIDAANTALKAAEAKSAEGILDSGSAINDTCDNCHAKYQRQ